MNKNVKLLILVLVFVFIIAGAYLLYSKLGGVQNPAQLPVQEQQSDAQPDNDNSSMPKAPDFTVYNAEGNRLRLSDFAGKPVVLNFWASWCGPCQMEMPDFQEKYIELGDSVHFLMVNVTGGRETLEGAKAFIEQKGYTFPVYYDIDADASNTYQAYSIPTTYFIDADGYAVTRAVGAIDAQTLQRGIDMIRVTEAIRTTP